MQHHSHVAPCNTTPYSTCAPQRAAHSIDPSSIDPIGCSQVFKTTLRQFALKKIEKEGAMVLVSPVSKIVALSAASRASLEVD
jgi:hypothetical protein